MRSIFTAQCYASVVYAVALSVCQKLVFYQND